MKPKVTLKVPLLVFIFFKKSVYFLEKIHLEMTDYFLEKVCSHRNRNASHMPFQR